MLLLGQIHTQYKENTGALLVASKDIGLKLYAERARHMFICHQQNAGQNHNIKTGNRCFESVAMFRHFESMITFRYLGTTLPNQKCLPRNAYYCSVKNLLSLQLLSKNIKMKYIKV